MVYASFNFPSLHAKCGANVGLKGGIDGIEEARHPISRGQVPRTQIAESIIGNWIGIFLSDTVLKASLKRRASAGRAKGWNAKKASLMLADLKKAHLNGEGAQTLGQKRAEEQERREAEQIEKERIAKETLTYSEYFEKRYYPEAKTNKGWRSYTREESLHRLWIEPVIGKMPFKNIKPFHLEKVKKSMKDAGKSPRSLQYALAVVRQVFNHAIQNRAFEGTHPVRFVKKPKVDNKRMRFLTTD